MFPYTSAYKMHSKSVLKLGRCLLASVPSRSTAIGVFKPTSSIAFGHQLKSTGAARTCSSCAAEFSDANHDKHVAAAAAISASATSHTGMGAYSSTPSRQMSTHAKPHANPVGTAAAGSSDPTSTGTVAGAAGASARLLKMLNQNEAFVEAKDYAKHTVERKGSGSRCVVVTCMDTRLTTLLPAALGIRPGDAKIIKNAGAIITHPFGGIMRSVLVALYELNADEVFVVGHYDCGMSNIKTDGTLKKMLDRGKIPPETLRTLQYAGIDLHRWLHGFDSVQESVRSSVEIIRLHPLVPKGVPVHGLIIDPNTGKLDLVVDGSSAAAAGTSSPSAPTTDPTIPTMSRATAAPFSPPPSSPIV